MAGVRREAPAWDLRLRKPLSSSRAALSDSKASMAKDRHSQSHYRLLNAQSKTQGLSGDHIEGCCAVFLILIGSLT